MESKKGKKYKKKLDPPERPEDIVVEDLSPEEEKKQELEQQKNFDEFYHQIMNSDAQKLLAETWSRTGEEKRKENKPIDIEEILKPPEEEEKAGPSGTSGSQSAKGKSYYPISRRDFPEDRDYFEQLIKRYGVAEDYFHQFYSCKFLVFHFAHYGLMSSKPSYYLPGEFAFAIFSLKEGLIKDYWTLLYPGRLPPGNAFEYRKNLDLTKLPDLEKIGDKLFSFDDKFLKELKDCIEFNNIGPCDVYSNPIPIFTMRDNIYVQKSCFEYSLGKCENPNFQYRIFPLELLMQILHNSTMRFHGKKKRYQYLTETEETALLNDTQHELDPRLGCIYHYEDEKKHKASAFCALNVVKKYVFNAIRYSEKAVEELFNNVQCFPDTQKFRSERHAERRENTLERMTKEISAKIAKEKAEKEKAEEEKEEFLRPGRQVSAGNNQEPHYADVIKRFQQL